MMRRRHYARDERILVLGVVAVLAVYYALPWTALSWLALLMLAVLAWRRLDLVLALLPLTFPFWYVPKHVTARAVFPLSEIVLALCVVIAAMRLAVRSVDGRRPLHLARRARRVWSAASWPFWLGTAAFVAAGALGVLVARRPHEALREFRWEVLEPVVYLVLLLAHRHVRTLWRRAVGAFLASAALLAALAAFQIFVWHVTFAPLANGNALVALAPGQDGALRATGLVYGSGNSLGAYLERALPLAAVFAIFPTTMTGASIRERIVCACLSLAYVPALVWSDSRGAWAGAAVGLIAVGAAYLWQTPFGRHLARTPAPRLIGMAVAALGLLALAAIVWGRDLVISALAGHNGSGEMRALLWLAAWHMIRDHPIFGIGLDQFLYYYSNRFTSHPYWITSLNGHPTIAWREPGLAHPHNLVLDLWLSVGVLGLAAMALILVSFFRICLRLWLGGRAATGERSGWGVSALGVGAGAAMLASLVHGMVDSAYFEPDLALICWWLIAVVLLARTQRGALSGHANALPAAGSTHTTPV